MSHKSPQYPSEKGGMELSSKEKWSTHRQRKKEEREKERERERERERAP